MNRKLNVRGLAAVAWLCLAPLVFGQDAPPAPPAPGAATNAVIKTKEEMRQELRGGKPGTPAAPAVAPTTTGPAAPAAPTPAVPGAQPAPGARPPAITPGPAAPGVPGAAAATASKGAVPPGSMVPKAWFQFKNIDLFQLLGLYADLQDRTILRPNNLPNPQITLQFQTDMTKEEAIQAIDSVLSLNGVSTALTGDKFVTVVPSQQIGQVGAKPTDKATIDLPEAGQFVTRVVQLTNAKPSEVVTAIQPFAKNPAGIVAIESSHILVLRDDAINVKRMLEMIEKIDVSFPSEWTMELIPIKYALAADMASVLSSLTSGGGSVGSGGTRNSSATRITPPAGSSGLGGAGATGTSGYPGGANPGATGTTAPRAVGSPTTAGGSSSFQDRLNQIVRNAARGGGGSGSGADQPILGDAKILPDDRSNSLLVFANKTDMAMIKTVIDKLDVVQPQVLIEAIIMEVSLNDNFSFGVSGGQHPKDYRNGFTGGGLINNPNGNLSGGNNFLNNALASNGTNALASIFPNSDGLTYFGRFGKSWDLAVSAIEGDGSINVLSRPRIQTSHAVQADLFIGDTVPYITGSAYDLSGLGASRSQYQEKRVGITLSVLPLINQEGMVVMDIAQQIQQLGTPTKIDGNDVPTTTERNATARVAVRDGETIFLGGFITSTKSKTKSGVPFLKDIPGLGVLFRSVTDSNKRTELIVLIRPTVLRTPEIAAIHTQEEREKLSGVKRAEMEILEEEDRMRKQNEAIMKRYRERKGMNAPDTIAPNAVILPPATNAVPAAPAAPTVPPAPAEPKP